MDRLDRKVDEGFAGVDMRLERIDGELSSLRIDMDARFEAIDARFEAIDSHLEKIDARFEAIDARFEAMYRAMLQFCVGLVAAVAATAFALAGIVLTQL